MEREAIKFVFAIVGTGNQQKAVVLADLEGKNGVYHQVTARFADTYNGVAAGGATLTLDLSVEDRTDSGGRTSLQPAYAEASTPASEFLVDQVTGIAAANSPTTRAGSSFPAQPICFRKGLAVKANVTSATGAWAIIVSLSVEVDP